MAVKNTAGQALYTIYNTSREGANPPVVFSDYGPGRNFSYCLWMKVHSLDTPNTNVRLSVYGTDGSLIYVHHNEVDWHCHARTEAADTETQLIAPVKIGRWIVICVVANNTQLRTYYGEESATPDPDSPVTLIKPFVVDREFSFEFFRLQIDHFANTSVCNFKYWNTVVTQEQLQEQVNTWDPNAGAGPRPMWASPLRTKGDISNVANPYTSTNWAAGHGFNEIINSESLVYDPDPAYMAKHTPCPTWVYLNPATSPNTATTISVNPGTTPVTPTVFKSTNFYQFLDVGSVPLTPVPMPLIRYYGYPSIVGAGSGPSDTFALYRNELGQQVSDLLDRFEPDTYSVPPVALTTANMYNWVFGAQFRYQPPGGAPTATGALGFIYLYVYYIGNPTGIGVPHIVPPEVIGPDPPPDPVPVPIIMSGLFAINKGGPSVDNYGPDLILKIPNPTIRTALIGE